jgi:polysaccharide export outer membrane protein
MESPRNFATALCIIGLAVILSACGTTVRNLPPLPLQPAPEAAPLVSMPVYRAQIGDVLGIRFLLNPELNEEITVRPDGMISTTVIEDVAAYGRTPSEISADLRDRYRQTLREPQISVIVRSFAPNRVYVAGEVANPGEFITVGPNLTISQALARAGGVKLSAARKDIFVLRRGADDRPRAYQVNYLDIISGAKPEFDARLAPFDVLYVPRTGVYEAYTFWNQFVQQFVPVSWGFSYNANPNVSIQR